MIYFIRIGADGPIKIGYTAGAPQKRLRELQAGCPYRLELAAVVEGGLPDERNLHGEFAEARLRGEWFDPTPELSAYIAAHGMAPAEVAHRPRGRPRVGGQKIQVNIYPPLSLWLRVEALAEKHGVKVAVYAVDALREKVERDKAAAA